MEIRPALNIKATTFQKWINGISLLITVLSGAYLMMTYHKLPSEIPMHFNVNGDIDNWGPKWTIFIIWGFGLILYFVNSSLQTIPQKYNYIVKITKENAEKQYKLVLQMMSFLKLELMIIIAYLIWVVVQNSQGTMDQLNIFVMVGFVICLFSTLIVYMIRSRKYR